jgi:hypothetical protein
MATTGRAYRFALEDEACRPIGVFESYRRGWRIGDWLITQEGRRLQIVGKLSPTPQDEPADVCEIWLVERA